MAGRFIKVYDKILNWEWFTHPDTLQLFLYLLLRASYKDTSYQGVPIERGQVLTSISKLGQATGQSSRMVRDNLKHLEMTGEVTSKATNRYRIITIVRYDEYQTSDKQNDKQMTSQLTSKVTGKMTSQPTTYIEYIESQNDRNIDPPTVERSAKRFTPPTQEEVEAFCREQGLAVDAGRFIDYYNANGWMIGRSHMKDWKATVRNWARRDQERPRPQQQAPVQPKKTIVAQQYEQRSYATEDEDAFQRMLRMGGY